MAAQALSGILVVALEQAVAAPLASRILADAGARVIKLERAEGDFARGYDDTVYGQSSYFVWLNGGKESIAVDIKSDGDLRLVRAMIAKADVFLQNLAPGAAARAGLGASDLRKAHPRLIVCDISGYGEDGPFRDKKAYDFLVQGEIGLASVTGYPGRPARVGISIGDIACGTQAAQAITLALFARERNGDGAALKVSLFHALADWMNVPYLQHRYGRRDVRSAGLSHPSIAPYGAFACQDGPPLVISIQSDREWRAFAQHVLGDTALGTDERFATNVARVRNRLACDGMIAARFMALPRGGVIVALDAAGTAYGDLNGLAELAAHPQARFVRQGTSEGPVDLLDRGARLEGAGPVTFGRVPGLNEHGASLRREFTVQ